MVLESQTARSHSGRALATTKKRSGTFGVWVVLFLVIAGAVGWFVYSGVDSDPPPEIADAPAQLPDPLPRSDEPDTAAALAALTAEVDEMADTTPPEAEPQPEPEAEPAPEPEPARAPEPEPAPEPQPEPAADPSPTPSVADTLQRVQQTDNPVEARSLLSNLLVKRGNELKASDAKLVRQALTNLNLQLVYSATVAPGDPLAFRYRVQRGDVLIRIANANDVTWQLLAWINGLKSADNIRIDQTLKIIRGPFHAVVDKSDYRMDLYLDDPDTGERLYINSVPVGLGKDDGTPLGRFIVQPRSKVINPEWADPRTGRVWAADDPKNPIGEFWVGLEGAGPETADLRGYGIHGTIDPDSIGDDQSMGCVRLADKDIELVYKLLVEGESTVVIQP